MFWCCQDEVLADGRWDLGHEAALLVEFQVSGSKRRRGDVRIYN